MKMKAKLMALILVAGSSMFAQTRFSAGVNFGSPGYYGPAPAVVAYRPPSPGPGYIWIDGYHDAWGRWVAGYWGRERRYDRDDYRFRESREREWGERDRDRGSDRRGDFGRGFRR